MLIQNLVEIHRQGSRGGSEYSPARIPLPPHIHPALFQSYHMELSSQTSLLC